MKSKAWYIKFPLDAYAMGPVRFEEPVDEQEVREYARKFAGVTQLPDEFECWRTTYCGRKNNKKSASLSETGCRQLPLRLPGHKSNPCSGQSGIKV